MMCTERIIAIIAGKSNEEMVREGTTVGSLPETTEESHQGMTAESHQGPCQQMTAGPCQMPAGPCQIPAGPCQMPAGPCQMTVDSVGASSMLWAIQCCEKRWRSSKPSKMILTGWQNRYC